MKCTSAIRQLAYDTVALDEYLQMSEKTSRDSLKAFCKGIMDLYGDEFLRRPTNTDVKNFMLFTRKKIVSFWGSTTQDLGCTDLKDRNVPDVPIVANDVTYKCRYYITDGIYPEWSVLVTSISQPDSNDMKLIKQ
ncbi:WAT1-related protein isoform X1 [Tanacetum coccineum]